MSAENTPGPWRASGPSKVIPAISDGGDYAILDVDGEIIAEAIRQVGPSDFRPAEANARLIAAAPELLEAATESLRQIEKYAEFFCEEDFDTTVDQLRAAIAKATGAA